MVTNRRPFIWMNEEATKILHNMYQACILHNTVNHTYNFVDPNTGAHTQVSKSGEVSEKVFKSILFSVTTDFLLTVSKI